MKREIKFRSKSVETDEWIEGYYVQFAGFDYIVPFNSSFRHILDADFEDAFEEVDAKKLSQWIGLRDKNGVEIYEGDIIEHRRDGRYIVSYGIQNVDAFEGVGFNLWDFYGEYSDIGKAIRLQSSVEVIGNIHDNPELLK